MENTTDQVRAISEIVQHLEDRFAGKTSYTVDEVKKSPLVYGRLLALSDVSIALNMWSISERVNALMVLTNV